MGNFYAYLMKHQGLAGGMLAIVALFALFLAVPSTWYHQ
jgi:hypothetical protein